MVRRVSFKDTAEAESTDTAFQGHTTPNFALPPARALIEGSSARDPQLPTTAIAPTGTKPRRSVVAFVSREAPRPMAASARRPEDDSAAAVVGSGRMLALDIEMASWKVKSCVCVQQLCGA